MGHHMSAIKAEHLFKVFGPSPKKAVEPLRDGEDRDELFRRTGNLGAVVDASFEVEAGELFVVMGLSGSGKSTLVRNLNRLQEPTSGKIFIEDNDISELDDEALRQLRSERISMVFQSFALFPHRSVLDNAAYGLEVRKVDQDERYERAEEALGRVGLKGWGHKKPHELSGGMRQRVGLARALATDAPIMLMDEPFSALDPLIRRDIQSQLIELQRELAKTIIFITHDLNEAMRLGDRIAVMKDGRIVQNDTPEEILNHPADAYVADFVQDVDRSRVITASSVMVEPIHTVSPRHGPKVAMLQLKENQATELYVLDRGQRLTGAIRDKDAQGAADRGEATIERVIHQDYEVAQPDTPISELLNAAAEQTLPIAIVEDGKLLGVLPRPQMLSALGIPAEAEQLAKQHVVNEGVDPLDEDEESAPDAGGTDTTGESTSEEPTHV